MFDDEAGIVEYELEREKWKLESNLNGIPSNSGCAGCLRFFLLFVVGLILFRLILEIVGLFV